MLATNGYFGLRVADIAAAAGLSTAAFHLYFSGREEAAREVLAGLLRRLYIDVGSSEPDRARPFARIIRDHLAAIQTDAPLVQALDQAVQLDPVLAELSEGALRLWRARLTASPQGLAPTPFFIDAPSAPDVLDLILAGLAQTARTRLTTAEVSQLAADIARACRAAQSSRPPPLAFGGARAEAGSARA
jgi:AcrR family transcriptional regulator